MGVQKARPLALEWDSSVILFTLQSSPWGLAEARFLLKQQSSWLFLLFYPAYRFAPLQLFSRAFSQELTCTRIPIACSASKEPNLRPLDQAMPEARTMDCIAPRATDSLFYLSCLELSF